MCFPLERKQLFLGREEEVLMAQKVPIVSVFREEILPLTSKAACYAVILLVYCTQKVCKSARIMKNSRLTGIR